MITPARLMLAIVILGAAAATLVGLLAVKSLPLSVSALAVLAVGLLVLGVMAAAASVRAGRDGHGAKAVAGALFGGLCVLAASGALTLAIVIGLLAAGA